MNLKKIKKLIRIANKFDLNGEFKKADRVDDYITKLSGSDCLEKKIEKMLKKRQKLIDTTSDQYRTWKALTKKDRMIEDPDFYSSYYKELIERAQREIQPALDEKEERFLGPKTRKGIRDLYTDRSWKFEPLFDQEKLRPLEVMVEEYDTSEDSEED